MLPKPRECQNCPAYGDGQGFVPDEIKPQAKVVVYMQGPGEDEEAGRRYLGNNQYESHPYAPAIGRMGRMMERVFLPLAGLNREDISLANTLRCRWNHKNILPSVHRKELQQAVAHCTQMHWRVPEGAKIIVAMGEYAFYATTGLLHDFSGWRGYMLRYQPPGVSRIPMTDIWKPEPRDLPVYVTHHLAYLWKEPEAELPAKRDWNKLASILDGTWPETLKLSEINPHLDLWPSDSAFDTEYEPDSKRLVRYSVATRDRQVWVVETPDQRIQATIPPGATIIMHNAPADLPYLPADLEGVTIEDTMYAHAVVWTGKVETDEDKGKGGGAMSHKLNFLGSMYARLNRWKHLMRIAPRLYSGADALGTMQVWCTGMRGGILGELERDPLSKWVYENLQKPLIWIILKNKKRGISSDQEAAKLALKEVKAIQDAASLRAQAYTGWPINIKSPKQLAFWLFQVEHLRAKRQPFAGIGGLRGQR